MQPEATSRPFAWSDVLALHDLVRSRWTHAPGDQTRIGNFWWTLRNTPPDDPLRHMRVWPRNGRSLAACAFLDPPASADIIVAPDAESLFDEALDWLEAEHRTAGSADLSIVVLANDQQRADALHRRGYAPTDRGNVRLWRALDAAPSPAPLPAGYVVRAVHTPDDAERRAVIEMASFGATGITGETWRAMTSRLPTYRADLDLIAVAQEKARSDLRSPTSVFPTGASATTAWYDAPTRCGELEAVGTVSAHRRIGLARAVNTEALRRLHARGAREAIVETTIGNDAAIALYQSCGFTEVARDYAWVKRR